MYLSAKTTDFGLVHDASSSTICLNGTSLTRKLLALLGRAQELSQTDLTPCDDGGDDYVYGHGGGHAYDYVHGNVYAYVDVDVDDYIRGHQDGVLHEPHWEARHIPPISISTAFALAVLGG
ncbi:uncharacterized protein FFC1_00509 [Fusarium fujikuroi]|nr:uncharacterized protein FFC1_00509 [Fusarium fujikuroi]